MNSGRREDDMLDLISTLTRNRNNTKAWLELYQEANLISPDIASHLWEVLTGINDELPKEEVKS